MNRFLDLTIANAATVLLLALFVTVLGWCVRRPALLHSLWLLVLLKLVTPPFLEVPLPTWMTPAHPLESVLMLPTPEAAGVPMEDEAFVSEFPSVSDPFQEINVPAVSVENSGLMTSAPTVSRLEW